VNGLPKVYQSGTFVEMRFPRALIGNPSVVNLHVSMINEPTPWTYAGVPSNSFTNPGALNPAYAHYLAFDLTASEAPSTYTPL